MVFIYQNTMEKKFVWRSLSCTRKSQFPSSKACRCLFVRFSLKSSLLPSAGDSSGFLWFLPTNEQLVASYWCRRLWNSPQTSRCLQKLNRSYNLLSCHLVSDYLSNNSNWHNSVCRFLSPFVKKEGIHPVRPSLLTITLRPNINKKNLSEKFCFFENQFASLQKSLINSK